MKTDASRLFRTAVAALSAALLFASCGGDSGSTTTPAPAPAPAPAPTPAPTPDPEPEPEEAEMATYDIASFEPKYSTDPLFLILGAQLYPEGAASDNRIAFVAHPVDTVLWEPGGMASEGLKMLAETGDPAALLAEAEAMEFLVLASTFDEIKALLGAQEITLSSEAPCLSYAQALKPNPDWFFGFSSACAVDEAGDWVEDIELLVTMFDAGTADGEPYMDATGATDPQQPVTSVEIPPWDEDPVTIIKATLRAE